MLPASVDAASLYCSCVNFVKSLVPGAPVVDAIFYKTVGFPTYPAVGRVALLQYGEGVLEHHVAVVKELRQDGIVVDEANFNRCQKGTRFIPWLSPEIIGFRDFGDAAATRYGG